VINLLPGISSIYNDTVYTFSISGMKRGMIADASMTNSKVVEIMDTLLFIKTNFKRTVGLGFDSAKAILKLTVTDRISKRVHKLERTFEVFTKRIPPVVSPPRSGMRWGTYLNKERFIVTMNTRYASLNELLPNTLSALNEWKLRRRLNLCYLYADSTTRGSTLTYRSVDLIISGPSGDISYHGNGNGVTSEMRRALRQQKGKSNFRFILHKQYTKGDSSRRDITDTLSYEPYKISKTSALSYSK
jgi:hypothetical protein